MSAHVVHAGRAAGRPTPRLLEKPRRSLTFTLSRASAFLSLAALVAACSSANAEKSTEAAPDLGDEIGSVSQADSVARPISTESLRWGEVKRASFSQRARYRAFTFDGEAGQLVSLYADGLRGLDTVLYLYRVSNVTGRPFGRAVAANDDTANEFSISGGHGPNPYSSSIVDLRLPETRRYALVVTTYGRSGIGDAEIVAKSPTGVIAVTAAELEQNPQAYDGRKVEVTAEPKALAATCTKMACSQANPCCNRCSAGFKIGQSIALEGAGGEAYGCGGNECTWRSSCKPFGSSDPGEYVLRGTFRARELDSVLVVESRRAAHCYKGGCSGQMCGAKLGGMVSTCIWRPEYACYRAAACEPQASGDCGWTQTPQLTACLANPPIN
jgi:hypothetical protein